VGKTTLAIHLAGELSRDRARVTLIDADPQGSALDWSEARRQRGLTRLFGVIGVPRQTLRQEVAEIARRKEHIVIDGPARLSDLARAAMEVSGLVVIPVQPSAFDIWATAEVVRLVRETQSLRPALKAVFVISRGFTRGGLDRELRQALLELRIPVLKTAVSQRVAFATSALHGQLVGEIARAEAARHEITQLATDIAGSMR
jgi:chromosome partitioning protein